MSSLDGGSATPPTADVPTERRTIAVTREEFDAALAYYARVTTAEMHPADFPAIRRLLNRLDRSGVAGEPEATPRKRLKIARQEVTPRIQGLDEPAYFCAPEPAVAGSPTPNPAPTPETPGAVNVAGGVTVPDEAVEVYRAGYGRSFRKENRTDRDDVRAGLAAAAPLIAAQALRSYADREHPGPEAVAQWTNYGTGVEYDAACSGCSSSWDGDDGGCTERVALLKRADELERGGDRG